MNEPKIIRTKDDFIQLCDKVNIANEMEVFDGMDQIIFMNEYRRIIENLKLTKVKTYSYKIDTPLLYNYLIGYVVDLHKVQLKINKNWLDQGKDENWWMDSIVEIKDYIAKCVKRIFYMNAYEEREKRLSAMRKKLDEKGIQYIDGEDYQAECRKPVKYED